MKKLEEWLSEHVSFVLISIFVLALISIVVVIFYSPFHLASFPTSDKETAPWGQMGDFFGGTLNPIFGFLSVMALLVALVIQSRELKVSSEELHKSSEALDAQNKAIARQSFEQTFFSWLGSYRESVNSIECRTHELTGGEELNGRKAMYFWWKGALDASSVCYEYFRLGETVQSNEAIASMQYEKYFGEMSKEEPSGTTNVALNQWNSIYEDNEYQLDSLFRNLYRLILWIDSQHEDRMNLAQKWFYISIVRAQLSWIEMVYLFYNGYTERGKNFKQLAEKYALFDNLNFDSDPVIAHLKSHAPSGNQYSDTAYDSQLARKVLGLPESTEETLAMAVV